MRAAIGVPEKFAVGSREGTALAKIASRSGNGQRQTTALVGKSDAGHHEKETQDVPIDRRLPRSNSTP